MTADWPPLHSYLAERRNDKHGLLCEVRTSVVYLWPSQAVYAFFQSAPKWRYIDSPCNKGSLCRRQFRENVLLIALGNKKWSKDPTSVRQTCVLRSCPGPKDAKLHRAAWRTIAPTSCKAKPKPKQRQYDVAHHCRIQSG